MQDLLRIESALPPDAELDTFNRYEWIESVQKADTLAVFRRCLGDLELSISNSFLSPFFNRTPSIIKGAYVIDDDDIEMEGNSSWEAFSNAGHSPHTGVSKNLFNDVLISMYPHALLNFLGQRWHCAVYQALLQV